MSASCVPIHPRKPRSAKRPRIAASNIESGIRGGRKVQSLRVAPGKIIKAQTMLIEGYSQREIGRVLHLSPHTVAKVVKTEDFQNFYPVAARAAVWNRVSGPRIVPRASCYGWKARVHFFERFGSRPRPRGNAKPRTRRASTSEQRRPGRPTN
jgi:hypothetical protein